MHGLYKPLEANLIPPAVREANKRQSLTRSGVNRRLMPSGPKDELKPKLTTK